MWGNDQIVAGEVEKAQNHRISGAEAEIIELQILGYN